MKVDNEAYKSFIPGHMGLEMLENHLLIEEPGYYNGRSLSESQDILKNAGYKSTSWKEFLEQNRAAFA